MQILADPDLVGLPECGSAWIRIFLALRMRILVDPDLLGLPECGSLQIRIS